MTESRRTLGIVLLVAAIILAVLGTSTGKQFIDQVPNVIEPDGKTVVCDAVVDKDSILSHSCDVVDTCRILKFTSFVDVDRDLEIVTGNTVWGGEDLEVSVFGTNKPVRVSACVPEDHTHVFLRLRNDEGGVEAATPAIEVTA